MRAKVTWSKFIIYCVLVSALSYILTSAFSGYFNFDINPLHVIGIAAAVNIFSYLIYVYPLIDIILSLLISVSAVIYYIAKKSAFVAFSAKVWDTSNNCIFWFNDYILNVQGLSPLYSRIIIIVFVIAITLILFLIIVVRRYPLISMVLGTAALSFLWIIGFSKAFLYMQLYVFVSFILYSYINYDILESKWKAKGNIYSKKTTAVWMACTISAMALVFLCAYFLPGSIKPVDHKLFNDKVLSKITRAWEEKNNIAFNSEGINDKFNISSVGYQEKPTKLGGAVRTSNVLLLKVRADKEISTPIYLRGTVKNYYTGSMWTKRDTVMNNIEDNSEIVKLSGNTQKVKDTKTVSITVYPQFINTTSLFNIWKPYRASVYDKNFYYDDDGEMYLEKSGEKDKEYRVVSTVPNIYSDELRKAPSISKDSSMKKYVQLPDTLPDRIRSLASKITEKYWNDFDKALAIQDYLRETYPYTLDTSSVPANRDFVDYFLFDEKKGYCTYFASAMAVMCRSEGIPARYVEGLVLDNTDADVSGLYSVYSNKAHAWVEVYFEGYGWVRFEPTSSYQLTDYKRPDKNVKAPVDSKSNQNTSNSQDASEVSKGLDTKIPDANKTNKGMPLYVFIMILILLAVPGRVALKVYDLKARINKADKLRGKDAVIVYLSILEKKLKYADIIRPSNETPQEFGLRIEPMVSPHGIDIKDVMNTFDSVRFGNVAVDKNIRNKFKAAIHNADSVIKNRKGTFKYIIGRYIL